MFLYPIPTCADAGPDLCTLHSDLCILSPSATDGSGVSPSAVGTKTPLAPVGVSPIATCAGGVFLPPTGADAGLIYTWATCPVWWWCIIHIYQESHLDLRTQASQSIPGHQGSPDSTTSSRLVYTTLYNAETKVSADASVYRLGAVLLQKSHNQQWTPVAHASRSLAVTEMRYAQIEKAAFPATWACKHFTDYNNMGKQIAIETDHNPWYHCSAASIWTQFYPEFSGFIYMSDEIFLLHQSRTW